MPTGRQYAFSPVKDRNGEFKWPRTQILNYPVQGLGHDLVTIARVSLWKRIRADEHLRNIVSFVSTVHDSIVLDLPESMDALERIVVHVRNVFNDVPSNFHRLFGVEFNLPLTAKISYGKDLLDMQPVSMV